MLRAQCTGRRDCKTAGLQDNQTFRHLDNTTMYITSILQYLIWPAFIVISWFAIRFALSLYEKKFPGKE